MVSRWKTVLGVGALLNSLLVDVVVSQPTIWYVDGEKTSSGDGTTWGKAFATLEEGLDACGNNENVWITQGTYYPTTTTTDRNSTFYVPSNCKVYGGFDGSESTLANRASDNAQLTILNGDIGTLNDNSDNVYHVVTLDSDSKLDTLTITNGNAYNINNLYDYSYNSGGGIFIKSDSTTFTLSNVYIYNNKASQGGGIFVLGSTNKGITISNCTIYNNTANDIIYRGGYGGGIYLSYSADATITDTIIDNNIAYYRGGGLYVDYGTNVLLSDSIISNNIVENGHGGGIFVEDRNSQFGKTSVDVIDSQITNNKANGGYGGGLMVFNEAYANLSNVIISNNEAGLDGGIGSYAAYWDTSNCYSCTFTSNTATNDSSTNNYGIQDFDYYSNVTYNLYSESNYLQTLWDVSQSTVISLSSKSTSGTIIYVDINTPASAANRDGTSWSTAYSKLQDGIDDLCSNNNPSDVEIWVAQGEYSPTDTPSWSTSTTPKFKSFVLCEDTTIYGGFDGTETERDSRDWNNNPTYFSSAVGATGSQKSYQIVIGAHNSRIDGMIFKRGYSKTASLRRRRRRRRFLEQNMEYENDFENDFDNDFDIDINDENDRRRRMTGTSTFSDVISDTSRLRGAGLFVNASDMYIVNSLFIENFGYKGGASYCMGYKSDGDYRYPRFYNTAFINNGAQLRGGAIAGDAYCNLYCEYCIFVGNFANEKGGAIYADFVTSPEINLSLFRKNFALEAGGAIAIDGGGQLMVINTTSNNNDAYWEGGSFYSGSFNIDSEIQTLSFLDNDIGNGNECKYCHNDYFLWGSASIGIGESKYSTRSPTVSPQPTMSPITRSPTPSTATGYPTRSPLTSSGSGSGSGGGPSPLSSPTTSPASGAPTSGPTEDIFATSASDSDSSSSSSGSANSSIRNDDDRLNVFVITTMLLYIYGTYI